MLNQVGRRDKALKTGMYGKAIKTSFLKAKKPSLKYCILNFLKIKMATFFSLILYLEELKAFQSENLRQCFPPGVFALQSVRGTVAESLRVH